LGFASGTEIGSAEAVWTFGEVASSLPDGVTTAVLAGCVVEEAEPTLPEEAAKDCPPDARVKLWDDGNTVLERLEGPAGEEACCCGTRKPTSAINATATKATIPAASSQTENGLSVEDDFMMPWVKISKLMQLVQAGAERRNYVANSSLSHCRAWR
jgi:hypothetical protein